MPTITVQDIPANLYELLRLSAATDRHNINSEIITAVTDIRGSGL